jgi:S-layer protein
VVVTGDGQLTLANTDTTITSLDASGIIDHAAATGTGGITWVTGALAAANTITGSAAGANSVNWTTSVAAATTYVGGSGADVLVFTNAKANQITLGAGNNTVNTLAAAGTGNNTITAGTGNDTVKLLSGNNTVDLGNGTNVFEATSGNNTYTGGTGFDTVVVGTGSNTIHLGGGTTANTVTVGAAAGLNVIDTTSTGVDTVIIGGIQAAAGYYTAVTGLAAADKIDLSAVGIIAAEATLGSAIVLGGAATLPNYLDAAVAGNATGAVNWFQFGGNTYLTVDNGANGTFTDGTDTVVQLVGLVSLSAAVVAAEVVTLA